MTVEELDKEDKQFDESSFDEDGRCIRGHQSPFDTTNLFTQMVVGRTVKAGPNLVVRQNDYHRDMTFKLFMDESAPGLAGAWSEGQASGGASGSGASGTAASPSDGGLGMAPPAAPPPESAAPSSDIEKEEEMSEAEASGAALTPQEACQQVREKTKTMTELIQKTSS